MQRACSIQVAGVALATLGRHCPGGHEAAANIIQSASVYQVLRSLQIQKDAATIDDGAAMTGKLFTATKPCHITARLRSIA